MRAAIGLDTSCYTTSAAAVDESGAVRSFHRKLLPVQPGACGLRQSEAVFAHLQQLPELVRALMAEAEDLEICAVGASAAPRDAEGSYMPVFTVGRNFAMAAADMLRVPYFATSHQTGHILAGQIGNPPLAEPYLAVHISGGTTESLLVGGGRAETVGQSLDLHAGQLLDRLGVRMGLSFPAGAALEQLALAAKAGARLPVSMENDDLDCHLSGAEAQCLRWLDSGELPREEVAAEAFDFLARTVSRMIDAACQKTDAWQVLIVGGVASSVILRKQIPRRLAQRRCHAGVIFGQSRYASDNAAGVARFAMQAVLETEGLPWKFSMEN